MDGPLLIPTYLFYFKENRLENAVVCGRVKTDTFELIVLALVMKMHQCGQVTKNIFVP